MARLVKESACNVGDLGLVPGLERSPGEGNGGPLQYSGLENSMNCIVHGVTKSRTQLSDFHVYFIQSRLTMHILSWTICVQEVLDLLRLSVSQLSGISPLTKEWVSEMSYTWLQVCFAQLCYQAISLSLMQITRNRGLEVSDWLPGPEPIFRIVVVMVVYPPSRQGVVGTHLWWCYHMCLTVNKPRTRTLTAFFSISHRVRLKHALLIIDLAYVGYY